MQERSKLKINRLYGAILLVIILCAFFSAIAIGISFVSSPLINSGAPTFTDDDLVCRWTPSEDIIDVNVTWYNGTNYFSSEIASGNSSTIDDALTIKTDVWICQVTANNGTESISQNTSIIIENTAQTMPIIKNSSGQMNNYYPLTEDVSYEFYVNSTDLDNDPMELSVQDIMIINSKPYLMCIPLNEFTGLIRCTPSHEIIKNSEALGSETPVNHSVTLTAREIGNSTYSANEVFTFTLLPVNDQPTLNQTINSQSAKVGFNWSLMINNVYDEELNYPISWAISAVRNDDTENTYLNITIKNVTQKTANITFGVPIVNSQFGLWNVTVNMSDSLGSNPSRPAAQFMFTLQINSSNFNPEFTTNFTNLSEQNWSQGSPFVIWLEGNDTNIEDFIRFNVSRPTDTTLRCNVTPNPWQNVVTIVNESPFNATAYINISNLTNNHVACRYVDFTIYDLDDNYKLLGGRQNITNYLLNIINVNDEPVMKEIGADGNMSNISVKKFQRFTYRINASDIDSITYDAPNTGTLYYYSDNPWFPVDLLSGNVTIYPDNDSFIGNWEFNITVSDGFFNVTRTMFVEIIDNKVPVINLSQNNLTFMQNDEIEINFSAVELENETMNLTILSMTPFVDDTYNTSVILTGNNYSGGINTEYRILNLTRLTAYERNALVGHHLINLTFSDAYGAYASNVSSGVLNLTIFNENDAPFFDSNKDNISDGIVFDFIVYNYPFSSIINATDFDLYAGIWANESINFSYQNASPGITNIVLTKIGNDSVEINFTGTIIGNNSIDIIVMDASGENTTQTVFFEVLAPTTLPAFHLIRPYFNETLNYTEFTFADSALYQNNVTFFNISENDYVIFDALVTNDTVPNNYLTFYWYVDGELNTTLANVTPTIDSQFTKYFNYFSSNMTHNITLIAKDIRYSQSSWTWLVNVSNLNRPPIYCQGRLQDLMVNGTTIISNYLSGDGFGDQRFYDPDDDPLNSGEGTPLTCDEYLVGNLSSVNYTVYETYPCEIIEFSFEYSDLIMVPTLMGLCQVQFNASDEYGEWVLSSDVVDIVVIGAEPSEGEDSPSSNGGTQVKTQTETVPVEHEVDKPKAITIIAPASVTTYANKTLYIPLKIKNTWNEDVEGIELDSVAINATLSNESNVSLVFDQDYFGIIPVGAEVNLTLAISNYRTEGPFEVVVTANVKEPQFNDSATILISTLEQMSRGDVVKAKITFAKDLLSENPVCRELNDLLVRAETEATVENYDDAIRLVDGVINGCKYLMKEEELRRETPGIIKQGFDAAREYTIEIVAGAGLLLILTLLFYAIAALKKKISEG